MLFFDDRGDLDARARSKSPFVRFLLREGVKSVKPASVMAIGEYREPAGAFYPSVMF